MIKSLVGGCARFSGNAFALQHAHRFRFERLVRVAIADIGDAALLLGQPVHFGLSEGDLALLFLQLGLEHLDGFGGRARARLGADALVNIGNFVGDLRGFVAVFVEDADFNQAGIAGLADIDLLDEDLVNLGRLELAFGAVPFGPFLLQVQLADDVVENVLGFNLLELRLDEVGVEGVLGLGAEEQRRDIRDCPFRPRSARCWSKIRAE